MSLHCGGKVTIERYFDGSEMENSAANHSVILNVDVSKSIMAISLEEESFEFILLLLSGHQMELLQRKRGRTCNKMRLLIELAAFHRFLSCTSF